MNADDAYRRRACSGFAGAVLLSLLSACGSKAPDAAGPPVQRAAPPPLVEVRPVLQERWLETVDAVGTLEANEKVLIKPEVAGRIVRIGFDEGRRVKKGDVLVELDPGKLLQDLAVADAKLAQARQNVHEQRKRLAAARAKIIQAQAGLDQARQEVDARIARLARADAVLERARQDEARTSALFQKEFKTQDDLERAISSVKQAEADRAAALAALGGEGQTLPSPDEHPLVQQSRAALQVAKAEEMAILAGLGPAADGEANVDEHPEVRRSLAEVGLAQEKLRDLTLSAPMDGILSIRHVAVGDYADKGTLLFELVDLSSVKTAFKVPERYISRIRVGQDAELRVVPYPDEVFRGEVYYIDPVVDEKSRTVLMKMRIQNPGLRLKPGLFANVRIVIGEFPRAVVISEEAVAPSGEEFFVFIVEEGRVVQRPIKIGLRQLGKAQVLEGLRPGETVVVSGLQKIRDGISVRVRTEAGPEASTK